jgi:hypothetical protein
VVDAAVEVDEDDAVEEPPEDVLAVLLDDESLDEDESDDEPESFWAGGTVDFEPQDVSARESVR